MSASRTHRYAVTQDVVSTGPAELAGTWEFAPAHTRLGFLARQMVITTVQGTFGEVGGLLIGDHIKLELDVQAIKKSVA